VPDYPSPSHEGIVGRLLDGRKPFKPDGKGYRDALLWQTVLDILKRSGKVALITQNWRDFAESDEGTTLHADLRADLKASGIAVDRVQLFPDLASFVKAHIEPAHKVLTDVKALMRDDEEFRGHVIEEVMTAIEEQLPTRSPVDTESHDPDPFDEPTYAHIDTLSVNDVVVDDARVSEPDDIYLFLQVQVPAEIDAFLPKGEYYSMSDEAESFFEIMDGNWSDYTMWVHLSRTVEISLEAKYKPAERAISDVQVTLAEVNFWPP
jgi:hypothetical protein